MARTSSASSPPDMDMEETCMPWARSNGHSTEKVVSRSRSGKGGGGDEEGRRGGNRRPSYSAPGSSALPLGSVAGLDISGWGLVGGLTVRLVHHLGFGWDWLRRTLMMFMFVTLLAPAFIRLAVYYITNRKIKHSVVYGYPPRNRLDLIYPPDEIEKPKEGYPVVIFVSGGAWIIGYKAWGLLLAKRLAEQGIIVALLDYRNFPQGNVRQMSDDVARGVDWTICNIGEYGGNPKNVHLAGQSAGAHISALMLMRAARGFSTDPREKDTLDASINITKLQSFVGISGVYDLGPVLDHFDERGLHKSLFLSIMDCEHEDDLEKWSPKCLLSIPELQGKLEKWLPAMVLMHGDRDKSVPMDASKAFADYLARNGHDASLRIMQGKAHVDPIVLDPLRGARDVCVEVLIGLSKGSTAQEAYAKQRLKPLWFPYLVDLAAQVSPF